MSAIRIAVSEFGQTVRRLFAAATLAAVLVPYVGHHTLTVMHLRPTVSTSAQSAR
jgi:hypothetical protein